MDHHWASLLLLLLTGLAGFSANGAEGEFSVEIEGVSTVTVGILYGFQCLANCFMNCQYSWTRGNVTSLGPDLSLKLQHIEPPQILTCTVVDPTTGHSVTAQKTVQVAAGPSNLQISGPPTLTVGAPSVYTCSADCHPSCSYSWTVVLDEQPYSTAKGNNISVIPPLSTVDSETLICEAQNDLSQLFISTSQFLWVASLSGISIAGDSAVTMGQKYTFLCLVYCTPSCTFKWEYMGKTFVGNQVEIPILRRVDVKMFASHMEIEITDFSKVEPLTCFATNDASNATINATKNLSVIDPISVRPSSQTLPVADKPFSLQCAGTQNPTSVTWLKNKRPLPASERLQYSPDNITVTFSPLTQADDGSYQCVVAEAGVTIQAVSYKMQVNYGPSSIKISGVDEVTIGIQYSFQCTASCYPPCQFIWTSANVTSQGPEVRLQFGEQPTQNLTCTAINSATGALVTAQKTLKVTAKPSNIHISGPAFLTEGAASNFTCSADCNPSCSYEWRVEVEGKTLSTALGNTISVKPPTSGSSVNETLICEAQNTDSHLYVSASLPLWIARLSDITITGSQEAMGKPSTYKCSATCIPSCTFTWKFQGETFQGSQIQVPILREEGNHSRMVAPINDFSNSLPLTCEATNTASNVTISTTKNVTIIEPFSVHPASEATPVEGLPFSLRCVGPQEPASITWFKNKGQMMASDTVHFSSDNTSVTFSPLLRADGGLYQCLVLEDGNRTQGGTPILSVGYMLQVNYGPKNVIISGPDALEIGATVHFTCSAECSPSCRFTWTLYGNTMMGSSIEITVNRHVSKASVSCQAENSVTGRTLMVNETLSVSDPHWCGC